MNKRVVYELPLPSHGSGQLIASNPAKNVKIPKSCKAVLCLFIFIISASSEATIVLYQVLYQVN